MVASSGGTESAGTLRRLNAPRPIEVRADKEGSPHAVRINNRSRGFPASAAAQGEAVGAAREPPSHLAITEILDRWRTDDRWWTGAPVSRMYYAVLLEDGRPLTIFHDLAGGAWFEQRYG
jgi:hypothetical protein